VGLFIPHSRHINTSSNSLPNSTPNLPLTSFALSTSLPDSENGYYDNACSYNCVNNLSLLYDIKKLSIPIPISGVGGTIYLTHKGKLKCLPDTNNINSAFYSKKIPTNLISLGYLQRNGATYHPDPNRPDTHFIVKLRSNNSTLGTAKLSDDNLLPINFEELSSMHAMPSAFLANHYNKEQLLRAEAAEALHLSRHHPSDAALCEDLNLGKVKWSKVTAHDVKVNRILRGPCVHCAAAKLTTPLHPPLSESPPASSPGAMLSFDLHLLPEPAPGGATHSIHVVDEFSGKFNVIGATSKTTASIFNSLHKLISTGYNAFGHKVTGLHGDAEKINNSLKVPLGAMGAALQLSLPGQHARRVERYTRTLNEHSLATLSELEYILPAKYTLSLHQSVAASMGDSINSRSNPLTPNEIVSHIPPFYSLPFGRCAMVSQPLDKRQHLASLFHIPYNQVPKAELGVSMGPDSTTKSTLFLIANGLIIPRKTDLIIPKSFIPFNWIPKEYTIRTSLPEASIEPLSLPNTPVYQEVSLQHTQHSIPTEVHTAPQPIPLMSPAAEPFIDSLTPAFSSAPLPHTSPNTSTTNLSLTVPVIPDPPIKLPDNFTSTITNFSTDSQPISRSGRNTHKPGFWKGSTFYLSAAITRKLVASKMAILKNKQFMFDNYPTLSLTNTKTSILPEPPPRARTEMSIVNALAKLGSEKVELSILKEFEKCFSTYNALRPISKSELEADSLFLRSQLLIKEKSDGRTTARLAIDGSRQPADTYSETHAGTSSTTNRAFILSCALAECSHQGTLADLIIGDCDVPGAFLQNPLPRSSTGGKQFYTLLPKDTPTHLLPLLHSKPTRLAEILGAFYGIKQSNNIWDTDFSKTFTNAGYNPCAQDLHTFIKRSSTDRSKFCFVNVHVDDSNFFSNSKELVSELCEIIRSRYGKDIPVNLDSKGICGVTLTRHVDHSVTLDMGKYILKSLLPKCGMDNVPPALTPSLTGFFDPPLDDTKFDPATFQSANGCLIHLLPVRHDIRKEIVYLCSLNSKPTVSCRAKQIQVLRYLKGCPYLGVTYSANPLNFPEGVVITGAADASHACHHDGLSHSAFIISIGTDNAPFTSHSSIESSGPSGSPCETEYITLSRLGRDVMFYRQFAESLGFPQPNPSILFEDNQSTINLTTSPELPKRSRHILQKHHVLRFLYLTKQIMPMHQGTHDIIPDGMTKYFGVAAFLNFRYKLMKSL
jgi:hypothetical protein